MILSQDIKVIFQGRGSGLIISLKMMYIRQAESEELLFVFFKNTKTLK